MSNSKDAADVTSTPKGLDVAVTQPGTIVGSHDLQGTDGTERTDRPGEILGTPMVSAASADRLATSRAREAARADHITAEVDRANREELPTLGGPVDDDWRPEDPKAALRAAEKAADAQAEAAKTAAAAAFTQPVLTTEASPAPAAKSASARAADSGIKVSSKIDR